MASLQEIRGRAHLRQRRGTATHQRSTRQTRRGIHHLLRLPVSLPRHTKLYNGKGTKVILGYHYEASDFHDLTPGLPYPKAIRFTLTDDRGTVRSLVTDIESAKLLPAALTPPAKIPSGYLVTDQRSGKKYIMKE